MDMSYSDFLIPSTLSHNVIYTDYIESYFMTNNQIHHHLNCITNFEFLAIIFMTFRNNICVE